MGTGRQYLDENESMTRAEMGTDKHPRSGRFIGSSRLEGMGSKIWALSSHTEEFKLRGSGCNSV